MDIVFLLGRILLVAIFVSSSIGHLTKTDYLAGYAESKGVPSPRQGVLVSGVIGLAGSALVALGLWADLGALLLIVFLVPVTFMMHAFWKESDPQARATEQINFHKNLGLLGGALLVLWLYSQGADLPLSLTDGIF